MDSTIKRGVNRAK